MNEVTIISQVSGTRHLTLGSGEYIVGRDQSVGLHVDDPSISRHHARITIGEEEIWVEDMDSSNGCFIDEVPIREMARLMPGQTIRLGKVIMRVKRAGAIGSDDAPSPYEIRGRVAVGGMGAIHEAHQIGMKREVAMKIMLRQGDARTTQRFIHEARITGRLEHPNIVPVHELGTDENGRVFYTMKYVRGTTLGDVLAEMKACQSENSTPPHSLASLLTVFQKVCDAVGFAHSHDIIHRDLKPENIMLGGYGEVLVMDWGLAKDLAPGKDGIEEDEPIPLGGAGSTLEGSVLGTPTYMSPEQARGEIREMDQRSDIYALGAILHEMLYLKPPVSGANPMEVVAKVSRGERDRIGRVTMKHLPDGRVPVSLRAIRRKALAYDPANRYQTISELQADIAAYQGGFATGAEGAGMFTHLALFVKRHQGIARSLAVAAIILISLTLWFTLNLIRERNLAEQARAAADVARKDAEEILARVEPARIEATEQRDKAAAALQEAEARIAAKNAKLESTLQELAEIQARIAEDKTDTEDKPVTEGIPTFVEDPFIIDPDIDSGRTKSIVQPPEENPEVELPPDAETAELLKKIPNYTQQPGWRASRVAKLDDGSFSLDLSGLEHSGLRMLAGANVTDLHIGGHDATPDLREIVGLDLKSLSITGMPNWNNWNISALRGVPLRKLSIRNAPNLEITPLADMPLEYLSFSNAKIQSIHPLRQMPLQELYFSDKTSIVQDDYSIIGELENLVKLELPFAAHGIDFRRLPNLKEVRHDRFHLGQFMNAAEYTHLANLSDEAWREWGRQLARLGLQDMHPSRVTVINPPGFDLDLRGDYRLSSYEIHERLPRHRNILEPKAENPTTPDLLRLIDMPVHRLYLDAFSPDLDLSLLTRVRLLRHLVLEYVPSDHITQNFFGANIKSITISQDIPPTEMEKLIANKSIKHVGYVFDAKTRLPATSRDEFFHERIKTIGPHFPNNLPIFTYRFDDLRNPAMGWSLIAGKDERTAVTWATDPPKHGGRGGGHLTFIGSPTRKSTAYYMAPTVLRGDQRRFYGGCLEFQLRQSHSGEYQEEADVILAGNSTQLVYQLDQRPAGHWRSFVVPIHEDAGWRVGNLNGPPASKDHLENVLRYFHGLKIRADFGSNPPPPDAVPSISSLDEFRIWSSTNAPRRIGPLSNEWKRLEQLAEWGKSLDVVTGNIHQTASILAEPTFSMHGLIWAERYEDRNGVLLLNAPGDDRPASVTVQLDQAIAKGAELKFGARQAESYQDMVIRVLHDGAILQTITANNAWSDFIIPLTIDVESSSKLFIEIDIPLELTSHIAISQISVISPVEPGGVSSP